MSLIKESPTIRKELLTRFNELRLRPADISRDAEERGFTIRAPHLSNYINGIERSSLTEKQINWLLIRYGIYISILLGKPVIRNGEPRYEVQPYNEEEALRFLNKFDWKTEVKKEVKKVVKKKKKK